MSRRKNGLDDCAEYERVRDILLDEGIPAAEITDEEFYFFSQHPSKCGKHVVRARPVKKTSDEKVLAAVQADPGILKRDKDIARQFLKIVDIKGVKQ